MAASQCAERERVTGRRRRLRPAWGRQRVVEKTLRLEIPQKRRDFHFPTTPVTTMSRARRASRGQTSYDAVRGRRGQVTGLLRSAMKGPLSAWPAARFGHTPGRLGRSSAMGEFGRCSPGALVEADSTRGTRKCSKGSVSDLRGGLG